MVLEQLSAVSPEYLLLLLVITTAGGYVFYQRFLSPLAGIPGPFWASLSPWWMVKHSWAGDMHRVMPRLHERHGKLVRTGPNEL